MLWAKDCTKRQARAKHKSLSALCTLDLTLPIGHSQNPTGVSTYRCIENFKSYLSSVKKGYFWPSRCPGIPNIPLWIEEYDQFLGNPIGQLLMAQIFVDVSFKNLQISKPRRDKLINPANPICLQAKSQCLILKSPGLRKFVIFPLLHLISHILERFLPPFPPHPQSPPGRNSGRICEESKSRIRTRPVRLGSCETVVTVVTVIWCGSTQE